MEKATFSGGCFWCTEAIFRRVKGVKSVVPGYAGKGKEHISYEEVSSGATGYHEGVQIEFDPTETDYLTLLEIFFKTHDPTSWDKQGADEGPQYRSIVFYHNEKQKKEVEELIKKFNEEKVFKSKIVTEVQPFEKFVEAEDYHKEYFEKNKNKPYCQLVINPKIEKLVKEFKDEVKNV